MIDFDRLRPFLLKPNINERVLTSRLGEIKKVYTSHRENLLGKKWDEFDVSSYTSFYLPTNYQKFAFIKEQLPPSFFDDVSEVIDFGTGPGTYTLAYLDLLPHTNVDFFCVDNNDLMLEQAQKLLSGLYPSLKRNLQFVKELKSIPPKKGKRLLLFGNSINELGFQSAWEMIQGSDCDILMFIEPGTSEVFQVVSQLRKSLIDKEFVCHYPCVNGVAKCPLDFVGNKDWCHQVWRGNHDESVERLGQMAKLDRKVMPFIGHVYSKLSNSETTSAYRVVRFLRETKFSFEWQVCGEFEGKNALKDFEVMKKSLSKKQIKEFKRQGVGEKISVNKLKEMTPQKWRVELKN